MIVGLKFLRKWLKGFYKKACALLYGTIYLQLCYLICAQLQKSCWVFFPSLTFYNPKSQLFCFEIVNISDANEVQAHQFYVAITSSRMFDGAWPNWWYSLVICACFVGFLYIILHCMIQDLQRDYRKRIKRRQKFEEWKKAGCLEKAIKSHHIPYHIKVH